MGKKIVIGSKVKMITGLYGESRRGDVGVVKKFIFEDDYRVIVVGFDGYDFEFFDFDLNRTFRLLEDPVYTEKDLEVGMKVKDCFGDIGEITSVYNGNIRVIYDNGKVRKIKNYKFTSLGRHWFIFDEKAEDSADVEVGFNEKQIDDLIDVALAIKDEKWFNELVEKKEALVDAAK